MDWWGVSFLTFLVPLPNNVEFHSEDDRALLRVPFMSSLVQDAAERLMDAWGVARFAASGSTDVKRWEVGPGADGKENHRQQQRRNKF